MLINHRAYTLDGRAADALLFGLAVNDVAGSGDRNTGQTSNINEFHPSIPFLLFGLRRV
jgi:hypothetical protein